MGCTVVDLQTDASAMRGVQTGRLDTGIHIRRTSTAGRIATWLPHGRKRIASPHMGSRSTRTCKGGWAGKGVSRVYNTTTRERRQETETVQIPGSVHRRPDHRMSPRLLDELSFSLRKRLQLALRVRPRLIPHSASKAEACLVHVVKM